MKSNELKTKFLSELSKEVVDKLTPPFLALIDETIESVIDGSTSIDGKKASNEAELLVLIRYGVIARAKVFQDIIATTKQLNYDEAVINYRGTILKVK